MVGKPDKPAFRLVGKRSGATLPRFPAAAAWKVMASLNYNSDCRRVSIKRKYICHLPTCRWVASSDQILSLCMEGTTRQCPLLSRMQVVVVAVDRRAFSLTIIDSLALEFSFIPTIAVIASLKTAGTDHASP